MALLGLLGFSVTGVQQAAAAVAPVIPPLASNVSVQTSLPGFSAPGFEMNLSVLAGSFPLDAEKKPWYKRVWFRISCVAGAVAAGVITGEVAAAAAGIAACVYISSG